MKLRLPSEFLYQVFALLFAVIVVHAAYVGVIRPSANSQLAVQAAQQAAGEAPAGNRSLAIDPLGAQRGDNYTIRGGSWALSRLSELRLTFRDYGERGRDDLGFRIARYAE